VWVFFDAFHCDNFNFKKSTKYFNAGHDLDTIHLDLFSKYYTDFFSSLLTSLNNDFISFLGYLKLFYILIFNFSTSLKNKVTAFTKNYIAVFSFVFLKERADYDSIRDVNTAHYADRYFQRPATEVMSNIIDFHNDLMVVLIFISVFIAVLLSVCLYNFATFSHAEFYLESHPVSRVTHDSFAEVVFTVVPAFIVYSIASPSFALLYSSNDWLERDTELTVSVTGHQWY
jgi:hypothetical protein